MQTIICLDGNDIRSSDIKIFGYNYHIKLTETITVSLTKEAALELVNELNLLLFHDSNDDAS